MEIWVLREFGKDEVKRYFTSKQLIKETILLTHGVPKLAEVKDRFQLDLNPKFNVLHDSKDRFWVEYIPRGTVYLARSEEVVHSL